MSETVTDALKFVAAKARWLGKEWSIEVALLDNMVKRGRCRTAMIARHQLPWRWEDEQFTIEAGDKIDISLDGVTYRTAELQTSQTKQFPGVVQLPDGTEVSEYSAFAWSWRE